LLKGSFHPIFPMKEITESEKLEDSDTPEKEENSSDVEETSETPETPNDEGEVLPAEKKNNSGCRFLIFILLLLTGVGGYLYYTHQIPPQIMQWIKPLIESQPKQNYQITRPPVASPPEKSPVTLEEKPNFEEFLSLEEEPPIKIVSPPSEEIEHLSGTLTELTSEPADNRYFPKISGNTTLLAEPNVEIVVEESEGKKRFVERSPVFSPSTPKPAEPDQPEKGRRNEAVQAYLDFFESALIKIGELIKTGFAKGKGFLVQSFG
jgi:hypothetical protein